MAVSQSAGPGSSRLMGKLTAAIEGNKYYEAHQLLNTLGFRLTMAKKYDELEDLLVKYSGLFLEQKQYESGMDVAIMLSKLYKTASYVVTEQRILAATGLLRKMPSSPERVAFISGVVDWAHDSHLIGHFHAVAAKLYINAQSFAKAWRHILRVTDGNEAAALTFRITWEMRGYLRKRELDLIVAHLVVAFMASKKLAQAETAFMELVRGEPAQAWSPLINGLRYLIDSAKMNDAQAFKSIVKLYEPSLSRDPLLRKLVGDAANSLFNSSDGVDRQAGDRLMPTLFGALRIG